MSKTFNILKQGFPNSFLEPAQHFTFGMSPLQGSYGHEKPGKVMEF